MYVCVNVPQPIHISQASVKLWQILLPRTTWSRLPLCPGRLKRKTEPSLYSPHSEPRQSKYNIERGNVYIYFIYLRLDMRSCIHFTHKYYFRLKVWLCICISAVLIAPASFLIGQFSVGVLGLKERDAGLHRSLHSFFFNMYRTLMVQGNRITTRYWPLRLTFYFWYLFSFCVYGKSTQIQNV